MTPAGLCQPADEIAEFVRHLTDPRRRYLILRTFTRQISACDLLPHVRRLLPAPGRGCVKTGGASRVGSTIEELEPLADGAPPPTHHDP
jgi:hypothetical protein